MSTYVTVSGNPVHVTRGRVVTSDSASFKTKELQSRRRLRLQQVREQSKDIAKTLRERADKERAKQLGRVEQDKREDYIQRQERLVQRLEQIHANSLQSVGYAHSEAAIINEQDKSATKPADQSKPRAKLAAAELKRHQQQELDKKRQLLDRKLIARNLANARSRLKLSKAAAHDAETVHDTVPGNAEDVKIKSTVNGSVSVHQRFRPQAEELTSETNIQSDTLSATAPSRRHMETQWSVEGLHEWIPSEAKTIDGPQKVDSLNNLKEFPSVTALSDIDRNVERRKNLFAVSEEMPECFQGPVYATVPPVDVQKPSLSIVTDFLRTRDNRLKKPVAGFHRVTDHELQGLRETFRTKGNEGTADICTVVDNEAIPVPSWQPVLNCGFCNFNSEQPQRVPSKINRNMSEFYPNRVRSRSTVNSSHRDEYPAHRFSSPLPPSDIPRSPHSTPRAEKATTTRLSKLSLSEQPGNSLSKKPSVIQYDHSTRTMRDLPLENDKLVEKLTQRDEMDAYSLALKESEEIVEASKSKQHDFLQQDRSKVAISRAKIAQEYKDTMAFLQTVSKDKEKSKPIESSHMNDHRQCKKRNRKQRKLENEFKKVQAETASRADAEVFRDVVKHKKQMCTTKEDMTKAAKVSLDEAEMLLQHIRNLPMREIPRDEMSNQSKDNLRKFQKGSNTVTFDFAPTSYKYTPSVKHTPPTKDKPGDCKMFDSNDTEDKNVDDDNKESGNSSDDTVVSDCSSDYDLIIQRHNKQKSQESIVRKSDVRKFIVYKIKDSSDEGAASKRNKNKSKLTKSQCKEQEMAESEKLKGIGDFSKEEDQTRRTLKSPNIQGNLENEAEVHVRDAAGFLRKNEEESSLMKCCCDKKRQTIDKDEFNKPSNKSMDQTKRPLHWDIGSSSVQKECECGRKIVCEKGTQPTASAATSAATFRTATSDKSSSVSCADPHPAPALVSIPGGYVKVLDEAGEEAGKFYIGAGRQEHNDPYEVIVQLKRRDDPQANENKDVHECSPKSSTCAKEKKLSPNVCSAAQQHSFVTPTREVQFSSSSSTVYMSPPDMILPKFLKPGYLITEKGIHITEKDVNTGSEMVHEEDNPPLPCFSRRGGDLEKIQSTGKFTRQSQATCNKKKKHLRTKSVDFQTSSSTSPQETRSKHSKYSELICPCNNIDKQEQFKTSKKQCCARTASRLKSPSSKRQECKHIIEKKIIESYKKRVFMDNLKSTSGLPKSTNHKSHLSPIVVKYINELLQMSVEGLKAVEIAALQCSTVSTPGSSIINVPSNVEVKQPLNEHSRVYAKINDMITKNLKQHYLKITAENEYKKNIFRNHPQLSATSFSDSRSTEKGVGDIPRLNLNKKRPKPKTVYRHKIKSLNISKNILNYLKTVESEKNDKKYFRKSAARLTSSDTGKKSSGIKKSDIVNNSTTKSLNKNNSTYKKSRLNAAIRKKIKGEINKNIFSPDTSENMALIKKTASAPIEQTIMHTKVTQMESLNSNVHTTMKPSEINNKSLKQDDNRTKHHSYMADNIHLQTHNLNSGNVMHVAEEKLQNMEKIADLTEKCTKRLSNLAKVLDEVRKNKSNIYNQISSLDTSSSECSSIKPSDSLKSKSGTEKIAMETKDDIFSFAEKNDRDCKINQGNLSDAPESVECSIHVPGDSTGKYSIVQNLGFVPILGDIPKPNEVSIASSDYGMPIYTDSLPITTPNNNQIKTTLPTDDIVIKSRSRPPPALSRINLKSEETLVAHELSTVLEVDSPMSTRNVNSRVKSKSPTNISVLESSEHGGMPFDNSSNLTFPTTPCENNAIFNTRPGRSSDSQMESSLGKVKLQELQYSLLSPPHQREKSSHNLEKSKLKMMDLNKFNEIMLKPFISIEEYARQYNVALLDEGSNHEDLTINKNVPYVEEEISSANSDGTLPDIISELLKRNVISQPFNYGGVSSRESNTVSSESNTSLMALSKVKRHKKKVTINTNKQDVDLTDSISFSSKVDLEKAFEELGIGWASSTLKKTKETLALSSSTSTLSSLEQSTNYRKFNKFDANKKILRKLKDMINETSKTHSATADNTHIATTVGSHRKRSEDKENKNITLKKSNKQSVQLQTSEPFQLPMTVNDFLANSLASKITFSINSPQREEDHFSSLYSTKLTTDLTLTEKGQECDSAVNQNSRQRTSTPVQLFKSLTFNSSTSSYNNSNGLFSNFDDLSSVKGTSASLKNSSSTEKDELTIPNCSLTINKKSSKSADGSDTA